MLACGPSSDPGGDGLSEPSASSSRHDPFVTACRRLHDECSGLCDNLFFECYADASTCATQWEAEFFDGFDDPLVDDAAMARCAEQVETAACTSIQPDTLECDYAIVDACTGDRDAFGAPYSPLSPAVVELGEWLTLDLCAGVEEFYAVELPAGRVLEIEEGEDGPNLGYDLYQVLENGAGDAVLHEFDAYQPIPADGVYLVAFRPGWRVLVDLRITTAEVSE
jgi:hypothetical protein